MARALGPSGRGALAAILIAPNLAPYFFSLGVQRATSFHVSRDPEAAGRVLVTWAVVLLPATLVAIVVLEVLIPVLLGAQTEETLDLARIWVLTAALAIYMRLVNGMLLGAHRYRSFYLVGAVQVVVVAGGLIALGIGGVLTLEMALFCTAAGSVAALTLGAVLTFRSCTPSLPSLSLARQTLWYGIRAQAGEVGGIMNARLDLLVVPAFLVASEVGYYSVATNVSWIVVTTAGTATAIVLPSAVQRGSLLVSMVVGAFHAALAFTLVFGVMLAIATPFLVPVFYGDDFRPSILPLEILIVGAIAFAASSVLEAGLGALNSPLHGSLPQALGAAATVGGLVVVLSRGGGTTAAALLSTSVYLLVLAVSIVLFKRRARVEWREFVPRRRHFAELRTSPARREAAHTLDGLDTDSRAARRGEVK